MSKSTDYLDRAGLRELCSALPEHRATWWRMYLIDKARQAWAVTLRVARPFVACLLFGVGLSMLAYSLGCAIGQGIVSSTEGIQLRLQVEVKE